MGSEMWGNKEENPVGMGPPIKEGGMVPKGRDNIGLEAIRIRSNSDSCRRLDLALRFWNQIFTCVSVNLSEAENSALSAMDKYCFWRNFFSKADNCWVVKGVRGLRFGLCLRKVPILMGPEGGFNVISAIEIRYRLEIAQKHPWLLINSAMRMRKVAWILIGIFASELNRYCYLNLLTSPTLSLYYSK